MSAPTPNLVSSGPALSLLLPTRARVHLVRRLLDSIAATVRQLDRIEVVLYIDCDDTPSHGIEHDRLSVVKLIRAPAPMGVMTRACYDASRGRTIMLLNDDTICRTAGWDDAVICPLRSDPPKRLHGKPVVTADQLASSTATVVVASFVDATGHLARLAAVGVPRQRVITLQWSRQEHKDLVTVETASYIPTVDHVRLRRPIKE